MRFVSALLILAGHTWAAGINSDSALIAGEGQLVSRTKFRYRNLEADIDGYLAQQTVLYGVSHKFSLLGTFGYLANRPGPDGVTDLALRGRFKFFGRDEKRATLTFSGILGAELPVVGPPVGSPDGGLILGVVGTWERHGWRIDADFVNSLRPEAPDFRRADVALIHHIAETDDALWQAVLELNYRRTGSDGVLFLSPGLVYEIRGWKFEVSVQVAVAEDVAGPATEFAVVLSVVHVF